MNIPKYLTLYSHIKTTERRSIIQQYGDWYTGGDWPLIGGLLHLVQRGGAWVGWGPAQSPHRCPNNINGQYTNYILFDVAL